MKVILCDDHPLFRGALLILIEEIAPTSTFIETGTISALLQNTQEHPDAALILLDLKLPDGDGLGALSRLRPTTQAKIVILSATEEVETIHQALQLGAAGFIPKSSSHTILRQAFQLILSGGIYIPPQALSSSPPPPRNDTALFTPRQQEVASLMARGLRNHEISEALDISENTVKSHLRTIFHKLNANNRTQAAAHWQTHNTPKK